MDAPGNPPPAPADGRWFVALRASARARRALSELAAALARRFGGRPLAGEDIHLTLAFVGPAPASIEAGLLEAIAALPAPGTLTLDRLGSFGRRLLWVAPSAPGPWLEQCAQSLRAELDRLGIAYDRKPFVAHLTLVRGARPVHSDRLQEFATGMTPIDAGSMQMRAGASGGAAAGLRYRWVG